MNLHLTRTLSQLAIAITLLLSAMVAKATDFEISRLATQLQYSSDQLAHELRYARGYSSVRQHADRLSREAEQLIRALQRNRSDSYVRSQFRDVSRRYHNLEDSFLRASRQQHNPRVYNQLGIISDLYTALNSEIYYAGYVEPTPRVFYYTPPVRNRRAQPGYGGRAFVQPQYQPQRSQPRRDRRDYGTIRAPRQPRFDHRSNVLDRQARQHRQPQYRQGRGYRPEVSNRGGFGRQTETRRRNHYE